jgi:hypothetical protein
MPVLLREELIEQNLKDVDPVRDAARQQVLHDALTQQRYAFQYFVTATFLSPVAASEASLKVQQFLTGLQRHRFLRMWRRMDRLAGITPQPKTRGRIKYFYTLSLDQRHQWAFRDEHVDGNDDLVSRWHVHMLLSAYDRTLSAADLTMELDLAGFGQCDYFRYDSDPKLMGYLMAVNKGNRVGKLQFTNDVTIRRVMERNGHLI